MSRVSVSRPRTLLFETHLNSLRVLIITMGVVDFIHETPQLGFEASEKRAGLEGCEKEKLSPSRHMQPRRKTKTKTVERVPISIPPASSTQSHTPHHISHFAHTQSISPTTSCYSTLSSPTWPHDSALSSPTWPPSSNYSTLPSPSLFQNPNPKYAHSWTDVYQDLAYEQYPWTPDTMRCEDDSTTELTSKFLEGTSTRPEECLGAECTLLCEPVASPIHSAHVSCYHHPSTFLCEPTAHPLARPTGVRTGSPTHPSWSTESTRSWLRAEWA